MIRRLLFSTPIACAAMIGLASVAAAQALGEARPWQLNFQDAFSPVMEEIHDFHTLLLIIITGIVLLVLGLLTYIMVRFNARRNPVPSKTAHNTVLEVVWTIVPVIILVIIAIPSLKLLYSSGRTPAYDMTLKVTGHQWYWTYTYPDHGDITFDSIPIPESDLQPGQPRLLAVDNPVVVPVGATVQVLVNSDDVIHNWAVPSLGLKKDATPGRTNETWFRADVPGVFYGMCSELCGVNHYFMPIEVHALAKPDFDAWVEKAKEQFASDSRSPVKVAIKGTTADR
jgi:cytochrome c oxidase subunit 2